MDHRKRVHVFRNREETSAFLRRRWSEISAESVSRKGFFAVALSGGKTPVPFYTSMAETRIDLPWERTHLFIADERFLPLDHPDSNCRLLKQTLLHMRPLPPENVHPVPVETTGLRGSARASARRYERDLTRFFKISPGQFPCFDLILLGIGEDGHTASLFPGSAALTERRHLAVPVVLDPVRHHRITLTLPVINHADNVLFLVTGENKATVVRKVVCREDLSLPASRVRPESGNLDFILDEDAGSQLTRQECGAS
jgi:6-phosphogluconolactonase